MKPLYWLLLVMIFISCEKETSQRNPFLFEQSFKFTINTRLPKYKELQNPPKSIMIRTEGIGIKGILVTAMNQGSYLAWELACPNHYPKDCQGLTLKDTFTAECSCCGTTYSLANGSILQTKLKKPYPLLNYQTSASGDLIYISN